MKRNLQAAAVLAVFICILYGVLWLLVNPAQAWPRYEDTASNDDQVNLRLVPGHVRSAS